MESLLRYVLKRYLNEYVSGLDGNMDLARASVCLKDLQLRKEVLDEAKRDQTASALELTGGKIGSLQVRATEMGKLQVLASDVVFDFRFDPIKALGETIIECQHDAVPGFVHRVQDMRSAAHWEALLSGSEAPEEAPPKYCAVHFRPEGRRRGEVRITECRTCKDKLQTNYVKCSLCAPCSSREGRCTLCSDSRVIETADSRVVIETGVGPELRCPARAGHARSAMPPSLEESLHGSPRDPGLHGGLFGCAAETTARRAPTAPTAPTRQDDEAGTPAGSARSAGPAVAEACSCGFGLPAGNWAASPPAGQGPWLRRV